MNRIMVIGISAGVGKSTFARKIGEALGINVYHLDVLYWKPNWVETSIDEFSRAQQGIVIQDQWIIEGNYNTTFEIRAEHADTIIYLELPLYICLFRIIKRRIANRGKTRPDMGAGCKEKIDWDFIKFIYTTYNHRKRKTAERLQAIQALDTKKIIIVLKGKQEIISYLNNMKWMEQ